MACGACKIMRYETFKIMKYEMLSSMLDATLDIDSLGIDYLSKHYSDWLDRKFRFYDEAFDAVLESKIDGLTHKQMQAFAYAELAQLAEIKRLIKYIKTIGTEEEDREGMKHASASAAAFLPFVLDSIKAFLQDDDLERFPWWVYAQDDMNEIIRIAGILSDDSVMNTPDTQ